MRAFYFEVENTRNMDNTILLTRTKTETMGSKHKHHVQLHGNYANQATGIKFEQSVVAKTVLCQGLKMTRVVDGHSNSCMQTPPTTIGATTLVRCE